MIIGLLYSTIIKDTMVKRRFQNLLKQGRDLVRRMTFVEKVFAVIFTTSGLLFVFIVPPFQNPDEQMHFYRSYQLAKGNLFSEADERGVQGGLIPHSMQQFAADADIAHSRDFEFRFDVNYRALLKHHYGGEMNFESFPNTAIYNPIAYIPAIFAHGIVALFDAPILFAVYLARIFSLLVVLIACLLALRIVPFGKWILLAICLLPMTIASAASISADGMTFALSILLITTVLSMAFGQRKVSKKWLAVVGVLAICVALVKQAHVALLPILALIPLFNKYYRAKKPLLLLGGIALLALICFFLWYAKTNHIDLIFYSAVQPDIQKSFILHEPLNFLSVLSQTYFTNNANAIVVGMVGYFGWMTAQMPILFVALSFVILYISLRISGAEEDVLRKLTTRQRILLRTICTAVFVLVLVVISAALYVYWTPVKHPYIMGIQGRYVLPILPLLLLPFAGIDSQKNNQRMLRRVVVGGSILIIFVGIMTTYARFYLPVMA